MPQHSEENNEENPYVSDSSFVKLFSKPTKVKILDVLLGKHDMELSTSEIADLAGISPSSVSRNIDDLVSVSIVTRNSGPGSSKYYRINTTHPMSKHLGNLRRESLEYTEEIHQPEDSEGVVEDNPEENEGLEGILQEAIKNSEKERRQVNIDQENVLNDPAIVVIGCGGAGNNTINRLSNIGIDGATTVALNTDKQHLEVVEADTKVLVGESLTQGLGAGGDPEMGERATEMAQDTIRESVSDADLVFVTAGMGGGTGTGAAPVVSRIAKDEGALVVGMVSTPFSVERARTDKAEEGVKKLHDQVDSVVVLDYNRLLDYVPKLPISKAFSVMDQIIAETIKGITETITQPSLINLDFTDLSTILQQSGVGGIAIGEAQGKDMSKRAAREAIDRPLLDANYRGASGGIIQITGGPDLTLKDAESIANEVVGQLEPSGGVVWSARVQEEYEGKRRVAVVMTGVTSIERLSSQSSSPIQDESSTTNQEQSEGFDASENFKDLASQSDHGDISVKR